MGSNEAALCSDDRNRSHRCAFVRVGERRLSVAAEEAMSRFKPKPMVSRDKRREREYHSRWSGLSIAEWIAFGTARAGGKSLSHPDVQAAIRAIEARDRVDGIKP